MEFGTFSRASEEVLKQRKIVRARRSGHPAPASSAPAVGGTSEDSKEGINKSAPANPFAGIEMKATTATNPFSGVTLAAPRKEDVDASNAEAGKTKDGAQESIEQTAKAETGFGVPSSTTSGGFGALSSKSGPAFGSGGGFGALASSGAGGFGGFSSALTAGTSSVTGSGLSFGSLKPANGNGDKAKDSKEPSTSIFGATQPTGTPIFSFGDKPAVKPTLPDQGPVSTGEEEEKTVFSGDGIIYSFHDKQQWRQKGAGTIKVNVNEKTGIARIIMRQKGTLRLLMNASLWAGMSVTKMEGGQGVTMALDNRAEGEETKEDGKPTEEKKSDEDTPRLLTYAVRIKPLEELEKFIKAVEEYKKCVQSSS